MKTNTVAGFLLEELQTHGARHIFGVPGDYILPFAKALDAFDTIGHIMMADERDAAWAANLAGRAQLSACYATSMVGCLNMLNPVCDATKNLGESSLVVIGGEVALADRGADYILHHELDAPPASLQEETFKMLLGGGEYAKSITDVSSAKRDISGLIARACKEHRPVYIGIPKDVCDMIISDVSKFSPVYQPRREPYDSGGRWAVSLAQKMRDSINEAKRPVLLVWQCAERFNLVSVIKNLARAYGIPVVATHKGFGAYPLDDEYFVGTYAGGASCPPYVRSIVEESDCLIKVGAMYCDMTYGLEPPRLPKETINIDPCFPQVSCGINWMSFSSPYDLRRFFEDIIRTKLREEQKPSPLQSFLSWMNDETSRHLRTAGAESHWIRFADIAPLIHSALVLHPDTPVVADIGNAMTIPVVTAGGYHTSAYGAMGVTVGALGLEISSGKRPLVIVGDGGFGMWSLGSLLMLRKYHSKMIVIVLNNAGWGMLRPIAENAPYLDLPSGHFEKFPEVIGEGLGFRAEKTEELVHALKESFASDTFSIINVILQKNDMTTGIRQFMTGE
jgi:indolepyruvate decarboxylase